MPGRRNDMASREQLGRDLALCNRCGFCLAACPTYQHTLDETFSPRGRLRLIKAAGEGELDEAPVYLDRVDSCTQCKACAEVCPSGVRPDRAVLETRSDLVTRKGLALPKALLYRRILARPKALRYWAASLALFRSLSSLALGGSLRGLSLKALPRPGPDLHQLVPPVNPPAGGRKPRARVLFFPGCLFTYLLPRVGRSVVGVLQANDFEVILPRELNCCGTPMIVGGDLETARQAASDNIRLMASAGVDALVTACASCGCTLKTEYPGLWEGTGSIGSAARELADKTRDFTSFLVETGSLDFLGGTRLEMSVTYHDPCHLARGMQVREEPRLVLGAVPGLDLREMREAAVCCGGAGTFQVFHPHLAVPITNRKVENATATGAGLVATECPACMIRLESGLVLAGSPARSVHVAEVLEAALQRTEPAGIRSA